MINVMNTVFIGNIAFDIDSFYYGELVEQKKVKKNGGACFYSAMPASLFYRVGIVSKIGSDFDINVLKKYNIDLTGLKILKNEKTTCFYQIYKDKDPKNRVLKEKVNSKMLVKPTDIPSKYLKCKYIHLTTNDPIIQLELIKYIRNNSSAIISIDTIKGFSDNPLTKKAFDLADIAFIDSDFNNLINCNAKIKIIKCGKNGCYYKSDNKNFYVPVCKTDVIDKTGAGDCMNGIFINLIANGCEEEKALKIANNVATLSIKEYGIEHLKDKNIQYNLKL